MKTQLSSIEISYLTKELKILINGRIDKIFQVDKKEFYIQFHIPSIGKKILRITDKLMYLTENKPETENLPEFCVYLRKQLDNSRLREINQKESERIVEFIFESKNGVRKLIAELFGGGNLLILDEDDIILSAAHYEQYKDRAIVAKSKYVYPKMQYNLFNLKLKDLKEMFKKTKIENLVKCLAIDLGLGGTYSEEVCLLAGVNKNEKPVNLKEKEINNLYSTIKKLINKEITAVIIYKEKEAVDALPFILDSYKELETKRFESFNEALDYYFTNEFKIIIKKESPYESQIKELKRIIGEQENTIKSLKEKSEENTKKGEMIYHNYQLIKEILDEINKASKKYSWGEIKDKLKGHKTVKDINLKDKTVVVEV